MTAKRVVMKNGIAHRSDGSTNFHGHAHNTTSGKGRNPVHAVSEDGVKGFTPHGQPLGKNELGRRYGSKSLARKAASALIAKIPLTLSRHIAATYWPNQEAA